MSKIDFILDFSAKKISLNNMYAKSIVNFDLTSYMCESVFSKLEISNNKVSTKNGLRLNVIKVNYAQISKLFAHEFSSLTTSITLIYF